MMSIKGAMDKNKAKSQHRKMHVNWLVNSLRTNGACLLQQRNNVARIMAGRLAAAKPLSKPMLEYCLMDPYEQTLNQNTKLLIHENVFEDIV